MWTIANTRRTVDRIDRDSSRRVPRRRCGADPLWSSGEDYRTKRSALRIRVRGGRHRGPACRPRRGWNARSDVMRERAGDGGSTGTTKSGIIPALEPLGLSRPELRAWAMYDWANSAMVCTIITAVFPIYYSKVAVRGLAARGRVAVAGDRDDDRHGPDRRHLADPGRVRRLHRAEEEAARHLPGPRADRRSRRCTSSTRATGCSPRSSSSWRTSAPTAASSSTTRSCRTSPRTTRSTASRPPATRSGTWAAGSCSPSTWPGSRSPRGSACRRARA